MPDDDLPLRRGLISGTAFALCTPTGGPKVAFSREELFLSLMDAARNLEHREQFVIDLIHDSKSRGLLCNTDGGFSFLKKSFHEFLVGNSLALALVGRWEVVPIPSGLFIFATTKAWSPDWEEVVCFFTGRVAEMESRKSAHTEWTSVIKTLCDQDDYFHHRLALACRCLAEVSPAMLREEGCKGVLDKVVKSVCQFWWRAALEGTLEAYGAIDKALPIIARLGEDPHDRSRPTNVIVRMLEILLRGDDERKQSIAISLAGQGGKIGSSKLSEELARALAGRKLDFAGLVAAALAHIGKADDSNTVVQSFRDCLREREQPMVRWAAIRALAAVVDRDNPLLIQVVKDLIALPYLDPDVDVRVAALEALASLGVEAYREEPNLVQTLVDSFASLLVGSEKSMIRIAATDALLKLGKLDEKMAEMVVPAIAERASQSEARAAEARIRGSMAESGNGSGNDSSALIDGLLKDLRSQFSDIRREAIIALGELRPHATPPIIGHSMDIVSADEDRTNRLAAVRMLAVLRADSDGRTEADWRKAIDLLVTTDSSSANDEELQTAILETLAVVSKRSTNLRRHVEGSWKDIPQGTTPPYGPAPEASLARITDALKDRLPKVRLAAVRSIDQLYANDYSALPAGLLKKMLALLDEDKEPDQEVRGAVTCLLARLTDARKSRLLPSASMGPLGRLLGRPAWQLKTIAELAAVEGETPA